MGGGGVERGEYPKKKKKSKTSSVAELCTVEYTSMDRHLAVQKHANFTEEHNGSCKRTVQT